MFSLLFLLLFSPATQAGEVALMLNLNYSSKEWEAFANSARACGKEPISVPPVEDFALGEQFFEQQHKVTRALKKLRPQWTKLELQVAVGDILREGTAWKGDAAALGDLRADIQLLHQLGRQVHALEAKRGTIEDQIKAKAKELKVQKHTVTGFAVSAHADGWNFTGESSYRLAWSDIARVRAQSPELFRDVQHVLLLNCYNMTENNRPHWRQLFPHSTLIAGFGVQAPKRNAPYAWQFITDNLDAACALDQKLITEGPLAPKNLEQVFRKLPGIRNTMSVIDYCYQVIEGYVGAGKAPPCNDQWRTFLEQTTAVQDAYMDLLHMTKDPPEADSTSSELRVYYTQNQMLCPAANATDYAHEAEKLEEYRLYMRENTIRLIHWWHVQKNFATYYQHELADLNEALGAAGWFPELPKLDGKSSRLEFVTTYNEIQDTIKKQRRRINDDRRARLTGAALNRVFEEDRLLKRVEEQFTLLDTLYFLRGEVTVGEGEIVSEANTLSLGGIPFNWIEPGVVLRARKP